MHVVISLWGCPYAALQTYLCGEASRFPEGKSVLTSPQVARRWTCRTEIRSGKNNKAHNYVNIYVNTSYLCAPYFLEQLTGFQLAKISPHFMQPERPLPRCLMPPNSP